MRTKQPLLNNKVFFFPLSYLIIRICILITKILILVLCTIKLIPDFWLSYIKFDQKFKRKFKCFKKFDPSNLRGALAEIIFCLADYSLSKIPYPFFYYVTENTDGGYAGISSLYQYIKFLFFRSVYALQGVLRFYYFLLIGLLFYIYYFPPRFLIPHQSLYINLLSNFLFLLIAFYLLPQKFKNMRDLRIILLPPEVVTTRSVDATFEDFQITISIKNIGKDYLSDKEVFWDFYGTNDYSECFQINPEVFGNPTTDLSTTYTHTYRYSNIDNLYPQQQMAIFKLILSPSPTRQGVLSNKFKIFYRLRTIALTYPPRHQISSEYVSNFGLPSDKAYELNVGEILINLPIPEEIQPHS